MMNILIRHLTRAVAGSCLLVAIGITLLPAVAHAATPTYCGSVVSGGTQDVVSTPVDPSKAGVGDGSKSQVLGGIGETTADDDCSGSQGQGAIRATVEILSWAAGLLGVVMIVMAGFKYIASGGDSGKVSSAKNALIYAIIGLVVAGAAQFLVYFVLGAANHPTLSAPPAPTDTTKICPRGTTCAQ